MKEFRIMRRLILLSSAAALAMPSSALAQDAATAEAADSADTDDRLEEIIVTAQRREQSLQDVPVAVSAFTEGELERRNVTEALQLVQYVPNLGGGNNTGLATANTYFLRGLGETESLATKDPPVGTYVDDIYFSRQSANNFAFFDVERIEVLRGPQGTLFGRNTTGGAIVTILKKPEPVFSGSAEVAYGSYDFTQAQASLNLPASDSVLTRVSGFYRDDNGYAVNVTTGERANDESSFGGRAAVRFLPGAGVTWDVSGTYVVGRGANLVNFKCNPKAPTECDGRYVSTGLRKSFTGATQFPTIAIRGEKAGYGLGNETRSMILASNLGVDWGDHAFNMITGYVETDQEYLLDFFDGRAAPAFNFALDPATGRPSLFSVNGSIVPERPVLGLATGGFVIAADAVSKQFTQELKFDGSLFGGLVDYVAGLYYINERSVSDFADISTSTTGAVTLLADRVVRNKTDALAVYSQIDVKPVEWLTITGGIRYTDERRDYDFSDNRAACQVAIVPATCIDSANFQVVDNDLNPATPPISIPLKQRARIWTPRFAVNIEPTENLLFYVSATRGFRSGGQSARSTSVRFLLPFGPETIWSYEAGVKSELFDRRLRLNVTGFYADTQDLQGGSAFVTTNPTTGAQTLSFVTRNFAGFRNKGIEVDLSATPIEGLNLFASLGYQDPEYRIETGGPAFVAPGVLSTAAQLAECRAALAGQASPVGNPGTAVARAQANCGQGVVTLRGDIATPVRAPSWTLAGGFNYALEVSDDWSVIPSVNVSHRTRQEVGASNTSFFISDSGVANVAGEGRFITGSQSEPLTIVNASVALQNHNGLRITAECSNCFDRAAPTGTLSNYTYLDPPRSFKIRARLDF